MSAFYSLHSLLATDELSKGWENRRGGNQRPRAPPPPPPFIFIIHEVKWDSDRPHLYKRHSGCLIFWPSVSLRSLQPSSLLLFYLNAAIVALHLVDATRMIESIDFFFFFLSSESSIIADRVARSCGWVDTGHVNYPYRLCNASVFYKRCGHSSLIPTR